MKTFLFLFSLILSVCSYGQAPEWFELGTTWTFNHLMAFDPQQNEYLAEFQVTEIVEFNGVTCSKIEGTEGGLWCIVVEPPYYVYESNDSVFYSVEGMDEFELAYVIEEGDLWVFQYDYEMYNQEFIVSPTNSELLNVNGVDLKRLELDYSPQSEILVDFTGPVEVLEYIGALEYFIIPFGFGGACDGAYNVELRCFSSPSFDYQNPEFTSCTLSNFDLVQTGTNALYPNPASESIFWNQPIDEMQVFDALGRLVWHESQLQNQSSLSVSELENGMYTVLLQRNGQVFSQKLMINQ